ncbi:cadherin-like and PC-esterase domain-containing protein 1 isoform X2 [Mugil cephalus]|uniref:cadherin-like and PC-esterase domain-containing protein 1 isoform X2 n=1 Tax=Mugil cephalus TaxID=48193 RepID=UPI001FB83240|nr:cadherin-like and PC-esterase domain-containing protein 1 isoform X2 [Mugil cephalus]
MLRLLLRSAGMLLRSGSWSGSRSRSRSGPLLLLGVAACVLYQVLVVPRNRLRSEVGGRRPAEEVLMEARRFVCGLEAQQVQVLGQKPPRPPRRAVVLTGRQSLWDTEVQIFQRVLQQKDYNVQTSRYAETGHILRTRDGVGGWSLLLCLTSSERSCLRRITFSHLQRHQMVNLLPGLMEAFSDAGGGLCRFLTRSQLTGSDLHMEPHACGSTNQKLQILQDSLFARVQAPPPALVAMVNVYVLVTSVNPLTSFLHDVAVVTTNQQPRGRTLKLRDFLTSHDALHQVKKVIGGVLLAATNQKQPTASRCVSCFQLFTFTLVFSGSITPVVVQVDTQLTFWSLSDDTLDRQVTRDQVLEDTLDFLLSPETHLSPETGQRQFQQQMKKPSSFQLLYPSVLSSSSSPLDVLLVQVADFYSVKTNISCRTEEPTNQHPAASPSEDGGSCVDAHLRQIYTAPPLALTPPFSPRVKEYRAEVTFDTVTVRIRPEPVSPACRVHLDEHRGPRMANYPVGLGDSRINILVTDDSGPEPVVMAIYSVHVYRESRPSLPMFGDHVTCSFLQDCGLQVLPAQSCGLQPHVTSQSPVKACSSGHVPGWMSHLSPPVSLSLCLSVSPVFLSVPGRWVVPCLSCSDNRTCDWREVVWQPEGCSHWQVERPLLQDCLQDRKVLFIGDSTNRGMMYFLMERVNSSLEDWDKVHETLVHRDLNGGRTLVGYSYYPQFWLEPMSRPTFRETLLQLLDRSRPLENSNRTVLVVGGVQWLSTNHLRILRDVLDRESLGDVLVVVKSLGMGFHLPVDGIRSLSLTEVQRLHRDNSDIIAAAKHHGYEVIDTFSVTMGRYKEFLAGRCACHFHEVKRFWSPGETRTTPGRTGQSAVLDTDREAGPNLPTYHVRGPVNQVYSEILLSRLCPRTRD